MTQITLSLILISITYLPIFLSHSYMNYVSWSNVNKYSKFEESIQLFTKKLAHRIPMTWLQQMHFSIYSDYNS